MSIKYVLICGGSRFHICRQCHCSERLSYVSLFVVIAYLPLVALHRPQLGGAELIRFPPAAALTKTSSRSHLQALGILRIAEAKGALDGNVAALTELIAASQMPLPSRLKALEWLLDLLPQIVLSSPSQSSRKAGSRPVTEGGVGHLDATDSGADKRPPNPAALTRRLQRLSLSEEGKDSGDSRSSSAGLVEKVWAALLLAVEAEEREVRLAAVKAWQHSMEVQGSNLRPEVAASLVAVASERLSDVDMSVQSAWRLLLPELLRHYKVGH